MAGPNTWPTRRPRVASFASVAGIVSAGGPGGARPANLAETARDAARGLPRSAMLPRTLAASVLPRRSGVGPGLPALFRHGGALRRNPGRTSAAGQDVGGG